MKLAISAKIATSGFHPFRTMPTPKTPPKSVPNDGSHSSRATQSSRPTRQATFLARAAEIKKKLVPSRPGKIDVDRRILADLAHQYLLNNPGESQNKVAHRFSLDEKYFSKYLCKLGRGNARENAGKPKYLTDDEEQQLLEWLHQRQAQDQLCSKELVLEKVIVQFPS